MFHACMFRQDSAWHTLDSARRRPIPLTYKQILLQSCAKRAPRHRTHTTLPCACVPKQKHRPQRHCRGGRPTPFGGIAIALIGPRHSLQRAPPSPVEDLPVSSRGPTNGGRPADAATAARRDRRRTPARRRTRCTACRRHPRHSLAGAALGHGDLRGGGGGVTRCPRDASRARGRAHRRHDSSRVSAAAVPRPLPARRAHRLVAHVSAALPIVSLLTTHTCQAG